MRFGGRHVVAHAARVNRSPSVARRAMLAAAARTRVLGLVEPLLARGLKDGYSPNWARNPATKALCCVLRQEFGRAVAGEAAQLGWPVGAAVQQATSTMQSVPIGAGVTS